MIDSTGDLERGQRFSQIMQDNHFAYVGLKKKQLVCTLCGSLIAGDMLSDWWEIHRGACDIQDIQHVHGKHRLEV